MSFLSFIFYSTWTDASVDLLYQEHLLQWMTVGDLLGHLVGHIETHHGGRCGKRSICIAAEGHRKFAARESLTILPLIFQKTLLRSFNPYKRNLPLKKDCYFTQKKTLIFIKKRLLFFQAKHHHVYVCCMLKEKLDIM